MEKSRQRCKGYQKSIYGKGRSSNLAKLTITSVWGSRVSSWSTCGPSDFRGPALSTSKPARPGSASLENGRPRGSLSAEDSCQSLEDPEFSPRFTTSQTFRAWRGERCQKCRWAGKRRIVSRRSFRRLALTRRRWSQHPPSQCRGGAMSPTRTLIEKFDSVAVSCSEVPPFYAPPSSLRSETPDQTLGVFEGQGWKKLRHVCRLNGSRSCHFHLEGHQKGRPRAVYPEEILAHKAHVDGGHTSGKVRKFRRNFFQRENTVNGLSSATIPKVL